jgi:hypothetical protein
MQVEFVLQNSCVGSSARLVRRALALLIVLAPSAPAGAQPAVPEGSEFQVNQHTPNHQAEPAVAIGPDGDFVVVWHSLSSPGTDSGSSIQGQRYASNGSESGAQFQVNTFTTGLQTAPDVAIDPEGDFVVVWADYSSSVGEVKGQRYASDGSTQGGEFQINSYTPQMQITPSVAMAEDGNFVVVWASGVVTETNGDGMNVRGRRFDSNGSPQDADFLVNTYTTLRQWFPVVAADPDGDFVVVWQSRGSPDASGESIQAQRYSSDGSAQGVEFQVNAYTTNDQTDPSVSSFADGDFVVVWESNGSFGTDTSGRSIQAKQYDSNGSVQGGEFQVNTYTSANQSDPDVATTPNGSFVVTWVDAGSDGSSYSVQGQLYAFGDSEQFQINTYTTFQQFAPSVAAIDGDFVVAWVSEGSFGTDTSGRSIQGQRYGVPRPVPAMSSIPRLALPAALLLVGAALARAYGSVSRRSRFSR